MTVSRHYVAIVTSVWLGTFSFQDGYSAGKYGLGLDGGFVSSQSSDDRNIDKSGQTGSIYLGYALNPTPTTNLSFHLGGTTRAIEGKKNGLKQSVSTSGFIIDTEYRWAFGSFEVGPMLRLSQGKTITLEVQDKEKSRFIAELGPQLAYRWRSAEFDTVAYFGSTIDLNVRKQNNTSFLVGVQFWLNTEESRSVAVATSPDKQGEASTSPAPQVAVQEEVPPPASLDIPIEFKPNLFQFKPGTSIMTPDSEKALKEIASALLADNQSWSSLVVQGHTNAPGDVKKNHELSANRAKSVVDFLIAQGIAADKLTLEGHGFDSPLPGTDPKAKENRRIAFLLRGVSDPTAIQSSLKDLIGQSPKSFDP